MRRGWLILLLLAACGEGELLVHDDAPRPQPTPPFTGDPDHEAIYAVDVSEESGPLSQAELDCLWESGARHLVVLTSLEVVARQQAQLAFLRGFTLDAAMSLSFESEPRAQVREAFRRVEGFSLGRMWLVLKQPPPPVDPAVWLARLREALDECGLVGRGGCGLFTTPAFWRVHALDSDRFRDTPLWYAHHDGRRLLGSWADDQFGGWTMPAAKRWGQGELCSVPVAGMDTLQRLSSASVAVDRASAPPPDGPPGAPSGLWPPDGARLPLAAVKLMVDTVPYATQYDHALERFFDDGWMPYVTWRSATPFKRVTELPGSRFRYRARAENVHGWGPFSAWQQFELTVADAGAPDAGTGWVDAGAPVATVDAGAPDAGAPPADAGKPDAGAPPADAGRPDAGTPTADAGRPDAGATPLDAGRPDAGTPPIDAGAPDAGPQPVLMPNADQPFAVMSPVALSVTGLTGTQYEFAIEWLDGTGAWAAYFTYTTTTPSKTFYPQYVARYRFRVRALTGATWSAATAWATFRAL